MSRSVEAELRSSEKVDALCRAIIVASKDQDLLLRFLRDLCTYDEILKYAKRWAIAMMLMEGQNQIETALKLGTSTSTVNNAARWVHGPFATGGFTDTYAILLDDGQD